LPLLKLQPSYYWGGFAKYAYWFYLCSSEIYSQRVLTTLCVFRTEGRFIGEKRQFQKTSILQEKQKKFSSTFPFGCERTIKILRLSSWQIKQLNCN